MPTSRSIPGEAKYESDYHEGLYKGLSLVADYVDYKMIFN